MSRADQHHRIDSLEFAVASIPAAKTFYGSAFDWTFQDYARTIASSATAA